MSTANKIRLVYLIIFIIIGFIAVMAIEYGGLFIPALFIVVPLALILALVITATFRCPYCGESPYSPKPGESNMNPYYIPLIFGKCSNCGKKI